MAGHVQVDTTQMLQVAQKTTNSAQTIMGHANTLKSGIDYVLTAWQGQTADSYRNSMQKQSAMLDKLINKLNQVAETVKAGGQGFDSTDTTGRQKADTAGQQFLAGPLNA